MPRKIKPDPTPFDATEKAEMDAIEQMFDDAAPTPAAPEAQKAKLLAAAKATLHPPKTQITTRLAQQDLARLKARALELGMPYQTLLASIVHQYVEGRLVSK